MTNPSGSGDQPPTRSRRLVLLLLSRPVIGSLLVLLSISTIAGWRLWIYLNEDLAPSLAVTLSQTFNRPVNVGQVQWVSWNQIQFGPSSLPAFEGQLDGQRVSDRSSASAKAVTANFSLWDLLLRRTLTLDVTLEQPKLLLAQAVDGQWLRAKYTPSPVGMFKTDLQSIRVRNAEVDILPFGARPQRVKQLDGRVNLVSGAELVSFDLQGQVAVGGNFNLQGEWQTASQEANLALRCRQLSAQVLNSVLTLPQFAATGSRGRQGSAPVKITSGTVDGSFNVKLRPNQAPVVVGSAQLQNLSAQVVNLKQPLRNFKGQLQFQGLTTRLEGIEGSVGPVPLRMAGSVDWQKGFNLTARVPTVDLVPTLKAFQLTLPVAIAGRVKIEDIRITGAIARPLVSGRLLNQGVVKLDRVAVRELSTRFQANLDQIQVTTLRALPTVGGVVSGQGRYGLKTGGQLQADLFLKQMPGDAIARLYSNKVTMALGAISAQVRVLGRLDNLQAIAQFEAPQAAYPTRGSLVVTNQQILLRNLTTLVKDGVIASNGQIAQGRWQLLATTTGVGLRQFSRDLRGQVRGRLNLTGTLASLSPERIRAVGELLFTEGLGNIRQPLTSQIAWDGEKIRVVRAEAEGLTARGLIFARFQPEPLITRLDLIVQARDYELAALGLPPLPANLTVGGRADLQGRLTGTLTALNLVGDVQTRGLRVSQFAFAPNLSGGLEFEQARGLRLQLAGGSDRLALDVAANGQPRSFALYRNQASIIGQTEADNLRVQVNQFLLVSLNWRPTDNNLGPVSGVANGNFIINLRDQTLAGNLAIARPGVGNLIADRLVSTVSFGNGMLSLSGAELTKGSSRYLLNARFREGEGNNPQFTAQLEAANGQVQDVKDLIAALSPPPPGQQAPIFARAADVQPYPVGDAQASLLNQIRRLSEIQVILAQELARQEREQPLPGLQDLQGTFNGRADLTGSLRTGLSGRFDFRGEQWDWGRYKIQQVVARGSLDRGTLNLNPLSINVDGGLAIVTGTFGSSQSRGSLVVQNFPVETVRQFTGASMVDLNGQLNGTATLTGGLGNPQLVGQLNLTNGSLNGKPIQSGIATFNYKDARLAFDSRAVLEEPEPLIISGSLPYQLPFARQAPASDQLQLTLNVKNEGLALLNIFTDQVSWVEGQGLLNLQVGGTLAKPTVEGLVTLNNATLSSQALGETLTGVTGNLRFNRDRLRVEELRGNFKSGQLQASGVLPLSQPFSNADPDNQTPLQLDFSQIRLALKDLYTGDISGNLVVTGTALSPDLGGSVLLSNGRVVLASSDVTDATAPLPIDNIPEGSPLRELSFNNLKLTLAENVQVVSSPVIDFLTRGTIALNGTIDNIQPSGEVLFQGGQVNLFTTSFRLAPGKTNVARFTPNQGLDPTLDLNLVTTTTDVTGGRINRLNEFQGFPTPSLGTLTSVRVNARVTGRASQLESNFRNVVVLTSVPARSEEEIIGLLGGGFVVGQSQQNASLFLVNLAGSAFLNRFQNRLNSILNDRLTFRLFPALIPTNRNSPNTSNSSALGLGAEVGIDLTDRISFSVLQVLTASDQPTQFNLGYQLTDNIRFSTSVDVKGEAAGLVEYRLRF